MLKLIWTNPFSESRNENTVNSLQDGHLWDRHEVSVLERCPSYRESTKGNKQRQGPTLGVRLIEVSFKRESTVMHYRSTFGPKFVPNATKIESGILQLLSCIVSYSALVNSRCSQPSLRELTPRH